MTDYTPPSSIEIAMNRIDVNFDAPGLTVQTAADWRELIASAPRLKQERDELLAMVKMFIGYIEMIYPPDHPLAAMEKEARELIERMEK